jgi:methylene-fatty-acyl-phospholipid synthase
MPWWWLLAGAALLLSLERVCYVFIARQPERFRRLCRRPTAARCGEPVAIVRKLLYAFKVVQGSVFATWCLVYGQGRPWPAEPDPVVLGAAALLVVAGQILNWSVFYRLGNVGVFYGDRLGYQVPWCHGFPFSLFAHPQYIGAVLTIWGFFLGMRYPHDDWLVLPTLETIYYAVGAQLEPEQPPSPPRALASPNGRAIDIEHDTRADAHHRMEHARAGGRRS